MRIKAVVLGCLAGAAVLFASYQYCWGQAKADAPALKIGVVGVRKVFRESKRNNKYRTDALAEQSKTRAELEKLSKEAEAQEAGMKALKVGSADYLTQYKELLEKRAGLEARQQFSNQQRLQKDRSWTEELYKEILRITGEMAQQKGLDLVFEKDEPEFPIESADELMMVLSTHKVLYSAGCVDLTSEVTARLDAQERTGQ